ncbi:MAG: hypothetical protein Edafosvirus1_59 [Edafosvirus sp.]|uniref:DUF1152 domain-containing protein n=1 Tax=Edafosvirus sp. TaxID=2487765 RepID=A0A3G4ZS61_9VIRU|nr:MAG: hypothetical protein Edafosvirus1_59 [Edafosvirus sp.]
MFKHLENKVVIISGSGGGADLFGGLPLYFEIIKTAKKVILANFSFTDEQSCEVSAEQKCAKKFNKYLYKIHKYEDHEGISKKCFPEARLASCLSHDVYAILIHDTLTVKDIEICYLDIIKEEGDVDYIYLVDGGIDVLLTGNEKGLGTPVEDMMHLKAVNLLDIKEKYVMAVGVDIDIAHGVHLDDLETRLKQLEPIKILEWKWDLKQSSVAKYKEIVSICQPVNTIVQSLIVASLDGHVGNYTPDHLKVRIDKNIIPLNSRICTAFVYPLLNIANDVIYLDKIKMDMNTDQVDDLISEIHPEIDDIANIV